VNTEIQRLENIPLGFDIVDLMKRLHIRPTSRDAADFKAMTEDALAIAKPRAVFRVAEIGARSEKEVVIGGRKFTSRVLSVNLEKTAPVFPFVCTCGMELEEWGRAIDDMLWGFWAEGLKEEALRAALTTLQEHLRATYNPGHISTMSPGSLEDWPISQQKILFELLGNPPEVRLSDSMLMIPTKSVSGITFSTDADFESCQLCARENCPGRRAPYEESLYERAYCQAHV